MPDLPIEPTEDELKVVSTEEQQRIAQAYELELENYKTMMKLHAEYDKHMKSIKDDMKNIWKPRFELYISI